MPYAHHVQDIKGTLRGGSGQARFRRDVGTAGPGAGTGRGGGHRRLVCESIYLRRAPEPQQHSEAAHGDQRGEDVRELGPYEVGHEELHDREGDARDQHGRQDLAHPLPAGQDHDQIGGDDDRKQRQLATDHGR